MNELLETLASWWLFDLIVFTKWWLYAPLCIPFVAYTAFFFVKWTLITAPFWLPLSIMLKSVRKIHVISTGGYWTVEKAKVFQENEKR